MFMRLRDLSVSEFAMTCLCALFTIGIVLYWGMRFLVQCEFTSIPVIVCVNGLCEFGKGITLSENDCSGTDDCHVVCTVSALLL
jgi:hypothetical protein